MRRCCQRAPPRAPVPAGANCQRVNNLPSIEPRGCADAPEIGCIPTWRASILTGISRTGGAVDPGRVRWAAGMTGLLGLACLLGFAVPASAARSAPDLVVTAFKAPAAPAGTAKVTVTIRNGGTRPAGKSTVRFLVSRDARLGKGDVRVARTARVKALKPRKAVTIKATLKLPSLASGSWRLLACADGARKVRERKEGNNCRASSKALTIAPPSGGPGAGPALPGAVPPPREEPAPSPTPSPTATPDPDRHAEPHAHRPARSARGVRSGAGPERHDLVLRCQLVPVRRLQPPPDRRRRRARSAERTMAVLRGRVVTPGRQRRSPACASRSLDHPELGSTPRATTACSTSPSTAAACSTLAFERDGSHPAAAPARASRGSDFAIVDDVVLVAYDTRVTDIDLGPTSPYQVAQGSDGHRRRRHAPGHRCCSSRAPPPR